MSASKMIIFLVAINIIATGILFGITVDDGEPFIAPMSEASMMLRWVVIAAVVAFLEFCAIRGWKRGG